MIKELTTEKTSLPAGWELKKMSDLFDVKSSKRVHKADWKENGVPFYRAREVVKLAEYDTVDNALFISEELYEEFIKEKGAPKEGDIIISAVGTLGKCYLVKSSDRFYFKDASVLWFENISNVDTRYIEYAFKSDEIMKQVMNKSMGATVGTLTISRAKIIEIPLPPLTQQKQIVAILDKAFAAIDTAKANAEQNLQNAKELFESYLQNVFSTKGDDWEERTLGKVTSKIGSGATPRGGKASYKEEGISLIRSMNVHDFYFKKKNLAFIDDKQADALSNVTLQEKDVLLNITGASIARCCMIPKEYLPARVNQHVSIIRVKKDIINPVFLASLLTSKYFKDQILEIGEQGATRQAITKVQLENFYISYPKEMEEQEKVVQNINLIKAETKKLEAIYTQKIVDLEEMKKSVLQKAFSGQLNTIN